MKKEILFSIMALCCFSCKESDKIYENETRFDRDDFSLQELQGNVITFDQPIMKPYQLMVYDSILITANTGVDTVFHVFNLNTRKKIGERIAMGQGPNEMISPTFINMNDSVKVYDMMTSNVYTYTIEDFTKKTQTKPTTKYKLSENYMFSEMRKLGDSLVCCSYRPDFPCYLFDANGKKTDKGIGIYPMEYTELEVVDAFRSLLTTNGKDRIAVTHFFTDLIEIYNNKGDLLKRLVGPDHFYTRFVEFTDGNRIGSKPDPNYYRDAYYSPICMGESFCVLYNGKFVNSPDYNLLADEIFVFGWDGTPQKRYKLDQGVLSIAVDTKNHRIYGISDSPEYHIVEYNY